MFQNPFTFKGRIRRTEFGISYILYILIISIINGIVINNRNEDGRFLLIAIYIALFWFLIAQGAKRSHDVGRSGWWQLIPFYHFWLIFKEGDLGMNQYGLNPKGIVLLNGQKVRPVKPSKTGKGNAGEYQGGYSGGHNSQHHGDFQPTNYYISPQEEETDGYRSGDLYK